MIKWSRVIGTTRDIAGVTTCECCGERTLVGWSDGKIIMCEECLELDGIDPEKGNSLDSAML